MKRAVLIKTITKITYFENGEEVFPTTPEEKLRISIFGEVKVEEIEEEVTSLRGKNRADLDKKYWEYLAAINGDPDDYHIEY